MWGGGACEMGGGAPPGTVKREGGGAEPPMEYGSAAAPPRATLRVPHAGQTNSPAPGISSSARQRPQRTITGSCYRPSRGLIAVEPDEWLCIRTPRAFKWNVRSPD